MRLKFELLVPTRHFAVGQVGHVEQPMFTRPQSVPHPCGSRGTCGTKGQNEVILSHVSHETPPHVGQKTTSVYAPVPHVPPVPLEKCDVVGSTAYDPLRGDPSAWEDELHQWATARCVFRDWAWGGQDALHRNYVEWSHATGRIPPATLSTFRAWVAEQGFTVTGSLIHGLLLAEDVRPGRVRRAANGLLDDKASERASDGILKPFTLRHKVQ